MVNRRLILLGSARIQDQDCNETKNFLTFSFNILVTSIFHLTSLVLSHTYTHSLSLFLSLPLLHIYALSINLFLLKNMYNAAAICQRSIKFTTAFVILHVFSIALHFSSAFESFLHFYSCLFVLLSLHLRLTLQKGAGSHLH